MRILVVCLIFTSCVAGALAQEINPNVLAPAARQALPRGEVVSEPPQRAVPHGVMRGAPRSGKLRRVRPAPPRPPIADGEGPFWPWD